MDARQTVHEALRQTVEGDDYTPLARLVDDLTPEQAALRPAGLPYSIHTVAWHTWYWAEVWNRIVEGHADPFGGRDPHVTLLEQPPDDWPATRQMLHDALQRALSLAESEDPARPTWRGEMTVAQNLLETAAHTAYHIGQIALIRQALGLWPPSGGE